MRASVRAGLAATLLPLLLVAGCPMGGGGGDNLPDGFTETPPDQPEGQQPGNPYIEYTFVARSPDLAGTLNWHVLPEDSGLLSERYTAEVVKESGYAFAEYGFVVGAAEDGGFLFFAIDTEGHYRIARKATGADAADEAPWTQSGALLAGRGSENELEVLFGEGGAVAFRINGTEVHTMTDSALAGGGRGIVAYVGSEEHEDLQGEGVRVVYRISSLR